MLGDSMDFADRPVRIVVFAKAPQPGLVKTRLIPALGASGAARLAENMLRFTLTEAVASVVSSIELCASPGPDEAEWLRFREERPSILWTHQGEGDLGERMARAAKRVINEGSSVLLVGTDCPTLDRQRIAEAAEALKNHDAVMIPSIDGGYVLLGLNRFASDIFKDIAWSTSSVAATTLERLKALNWSVAVLASLRDIDEPEDLCTIL